jgi:uncharacterized membrane protein
MEPKNDLDKRYRTLVVLWFGMLMSIATLFVFTLFIGPPFSGGPTSGPNKILLFVFAAVGMFLVVLSFAVKGKLLARSVDQQDASLVQTALVISLAMCEVSALLGVVERLVVGNREYYLLFLLAVIGLVLHFPRREALVAATWKATTGGTV